MTSFFAAKGTTQTTTPKKKKAATQTSTESFFGKRPAPQNAAVSTRKHTEEGRFQFFFFGEMDLVQTYVPNNGYKREQFERRRLWDESMLKFLSQRTQILQHVNKTRRLLWTGDLNCAMDHRDGTHWEKCNNGSIVEWWTQEKKCFSVSQKVCENRTSEEIGMPSFTPGERSRFVQLVSQGNLVDVWRNLHPDVCSAERSELSRWEQPDMTWRGSLSANGWSRYEGKGQRIDYFLMSKADVDAVVSCDILGYGTQRVGFCGSDHSPVSLVLSKPSKEACALNE
jgi:exonuclease III